MFDRDDHASYFDALCLAEALAGKLRNALIAEMQRFARGEAFGERAMPELDSEAVSFRAASESFAVVRRLERRDMKTPRLAIRYQGRKVPTAGGILLFGIDRLTLRALRMSCFPAW